VTQITGGWRPLARGVIEGTGSICVIKKDNWVLGQGELVCYSVPGRITAVGSKRMKPFKKIWGLLPKP